MLQCFGFTMNLPDSDDQNKALKTPFIMSCIPPTTRDIPSAWAEKLPFPRSVEWNTAAKVQQKIDTCKYFSLFFLHPKKICTFIEIKKQSLVSETLKSIISKYYACLTHPVSQVKKTIDYLSTIGQQDTIHNTFFTLRNAALQLTVADI